MADDINKKISIDVEINTDGKQQIEQYKSSFDSLRYSIDALSKPLSELSKNINSLDKDISSIANSVNKLSSQNQTLDSSSGKLLNTVTGLSLTFKIWKDVVKACKEGFDLFEVSLSGGLTLITVFGPEIIKWVGNMLKGNTTLSALNKTLRDHKVALEAVTQARLQGDQNAQEELVHLKLLYSASQDQKLALVERKKAIAELKAEYPGYFGNMSSELILTGKATNAYNDLAKAIIATARAKAAEQMLIKNSTRQLGDESKVSDLQKQLAAKKAELKAAQKDHYDILSASQYSGSSVGAPTTDSAGDAAITRLQEETDALQKTIQDAKNDSQILDTQNKALVKVVSDNVEQTGVKVLTALKNVTDEGSKIVRSASKKQIKAINKQIEAYDKLGVKVDEVNAKQTTSSKTGIQSAPSSSNFPSPNPTDPTPDADDQTALNAIVLTDAQKTADALREIRSKELSQEMKDGEEKLKEKLAKEKQAAQQLKDVELQTAQQVSSAAFSILQNGIKQQTDAKLAALEKDKAAALNNSSLTSAQRLAIEAKYKKQEDQVKLKAFKEEQEASLAQAVINGALAITKATSQSGVLSPLVVPEIIAGTAIEIAKIVSQKPPAYATGGLHYTSDGKGGLLPGYSRSDNTNAYLRSGEGIVVSEAMRDPWPATW